MTKKQKSKATKKALLPRKPSFPPGCCSVSELGNFGALTHHAKAGQEIIFDIYEESTEKILST